MSGLHEVDCSGCGRRHVTSGEQARKQRVLRCECGQFVRLDRALRSEPTPPPPIAIVGASEEESEDDATHMLRLAAVAAERGRGRARSAQPSLVDDERASRPVSRASTLRSLPPAPARQPSIAPSEKPLWYVDLGGIDLVEMTIEQLILARRSGKLGEGALVWREGMPSWRPVGTLIPAASASSPPSAAPIPTPVPSRPAAAPAIRTPLPGRPPPPVRTAAPSPPTEDATPHSLASYERPLATLEFALEKPAPAAFFAPTRSPLPSIDYSAGQLSRPPSPLPRAARSAPFNGASPRPPSSPPAGALATPMPSPVASPLPPAPPPAPVAQPSPLPAGRSSDYPKQGPLASLRALDPISGRPRWVSACIALVVCITASAAGATLVRSLKQHPKPSLPLSPPEPALTAATGNRASELPTPIPSSAPQVVDLESLSVEPKRSAPRAARVAPRPAPVATESSEDSEAPASDSTPTPAAPEAEKSSDSPPAARPSPYGSGSLIDQIKKATADEDSSQ